MDFDDAESFCTSQGGKMYEPRDKTIWENVFDYAKKEEIGEFWLGIHDKNEEGTFIYASDKWPIEFNNFEKGEPNNGASNLVYSGEDCVHVIYQPAAEGFWNDLPCNSHQMSVVCVRVNSGRVPTTPILTKPRLCSIVPIFRRL